MDGWLLIIRWGMFDVCRALVALLISTTGLSFGGYIHTHLYINMTQQFAYMHLHDMNYMKQADCIRENENE